MNTDQATQKTPVDTDSHAHLSALIDFLKQGKRLALLTGAGISVASGIPTYRDHTGRWQRSDPIQHKDFIEKRDKRQRYWARSAIGWPLVERARHNTAHTVLATLEQRGACTGLITQNVDRLHQAAGQQNVIDLHGRLDRVICLDCNQKETRANLQERLLHDNPFLSSITATPTPDGDADFEDFATENIRIPSCLHCGGTLMPDVVFFGGTVPKWRVDKAWEWIHASDGMLVVGSSLSVYSGYRFARYFENKAGLPTKRLFVINQGVTRADHFIDHKIRLSCEHALRLIDQQLRAPE